MWCLVALHGTRVRALHSPSIKPFKEEYGATEWQKLAKPARDCLGGPTFITMMQSSDFGNRNDLSGASWLDRPRLGRVLV